MSSATNRGGQREPDDYYATPAWTVDRLIAKLPTSTKEAWWIDPGCGDGAIIERMITTAKVDPGYVIGVETNKPRADIARERFPGAAVLDADYLDTETVDSYLNRLAEGPFAIVGNPPYTHAMEFVQRSLDIAKTRRGSVVAFLLRLAFLETKTRAPFHIANPSRVIVLPRRPSFCHSFKCKVCKLQFSKATTVARFACPSCSKPMSKTTSDATAYAWFVWGDDKPGRWEIL